MRQMTAPELAERLADPSRPAPLLLDVREPWEVARCALPGIVSIPLQQLPARSEELDPDAEVVCICHHGARSASAAMFLERERGFTQTINLSGGIDAWALQVDPSTPRY
ncbi:rhodanese-like domain-containing protein [Chitinasiproducens palmae]|uniref:Rhodanese-related sulfurtransferase n=1 Tax=Chitinasiproducens palmae TaxID=1770053 RepID=A0A1H2PMP6_9BURK|nr:rhodanese-like domain-containing protein [Chitinasiproducens palmae]SDV47803.1 Rhodanese-related sulfurtransferase [Chitinasiproducens palmae]